MSLLSLKAILGSSASTIVVRYDLRLVVVRIWMSVNHDRAAPLTALVCVLGLCSVKNRDEA